MYKSKKFKNLKHHFPCLTTTKINKQINKNSEKNNKH